MVKADLRLDVQANAVFVQSTLMKMRYLMRPCRAGASQKKSRISGSQEFNREASNNLTSGQTVKSRKPGCL